MAVIDLDGPRPVRRSPRRRPRVLLVLAALVPALALAGERPVHEPIDPVEVCLRTGELTAGKVVTIDPGTGQVQVTLSCRLVTTPGRTS